MDDVDLVVQAFDEAERDLVLGSAVGGDAVPVAVDHRGELLVGFEPLPFEALAPVLEEAARPGLALVVPELAERLLQHIGRVQPFVGGKQCLQRPASVEVEVLDGRDSRVYFWPLM